MRSDDLYELARVAQSALADLAKAGTGIIDSRFKDQPDESRAVYLSNVKGGITRVQEALSELNRMCEVAGHLWQMNESLEESLAETWRQHEEFARMLNGPMTKGVDTCDR